MKIGVFQFAVNILANIVLMVSYYYRFKVHQLFEYLRAIFKVLFKSVGSIIILIPILLVIVLLSIFSGDLWFVLGNLQVEKIAYVALLMIIPIALLTIVLLNRIVKKIVGNFPSEEKLFNSLESFQPFRNSLEKGYIAIEDWSAAKNNLTWRNQNKISAALTPLVTKKVRHWILILFAITNLIVFLGFLTYFCILFETLLDPEVISKWTSVSVQEMDYAFEIFNNRFEIPYHSTDISIVNVAVVLSIFITLASNVYSLTDENALARMTGWLTEKSQLWFSLGAVYESVAYPNYQIWGLTEKNKRKGIIKMAIVVPRNSDDEEVELACEHLEDQLKSFKNIVQITAYEENVENPFYTPNAAGKQWLFFINKLSNSRVFSPSDVSDEETHSQHFLGKENVEKDIEIPKEWFGDDLVSVQLSKKIWEDDPDHLLILHPHSSISDNGLFLNICLTRRLTNSKSYREIAKEYLNIAKKASPQSPNIFVTITYRDTGDNLVSLSWYSKLPTVYYKDECMKRSKNEKNSLWLDI